MPSTLAKDICAADGSCDTFRLVGPGASCRTMNVNASRDMYIANNTSLHPAAMCEVQEGGGNFPSSYWVYCDGADGFGWGGVDVDLIGNFDLPPDVLHQSCLQNPSCTAFSVDNSGARGTMFKKAAPGKVASGWFGLPAPPVPRKSWSKRALPEQFLPSAPSLEHVLHLPHGSNAGQYTEAVCLTSRAYVTTHVGVLATWTAQCESRGTGQARRLHSCSAHIRLCFMLMIEVCSTMWCSPLYTCVPHVFNCLYVWVVCVTAGARLVVSRRGAAL